MWFSVLIHRFYCTGAGFERGFCSAHILMDFFLFSLLDPGCLLLRDLAGPIFKPYFQLPWKSFCHFTVPRRVCGRCCAPVSAKHISWVQRFPRAGPPGSVMPGLPKDARASCPLQGVPGNFRCLADPGAGKQKQAWGCLPSLPGSRGTRKKA